MLSLVSYDLVFWRYRPGTRRNPESVYQELMGGGAPDDLEELPVESIALSVLTAFPDATREPRGLDSEWINWASSDEKSSFQVEWTTRHVHVACRGVENETVNALIDILNEFGCPLYDPQTVERFDSELSN